MTHRILTRMFVLLTLVVFGISLAAPVSAAPPSHATVSGIVSATDGAPIPSAAVEVSELWKGAFRPVATLSTPGDGSWTFSGKANTYRFDFAAADCDPASRTLVLEKGQAYVLDVALQAYGSISGSVLSSATGAPLSGASVEFFRRNLDGTWPTAPEASTVSLDDGTFQSGRLPAGVYAVRAAAIGCVAAYLGGATAIEDAEQLTVARGSVLSGASIGLAAAVPLGTGSISGVVVSGASRTPMVNAYVFIYKQNEDGSWPATSPGWGSPYRTVYTALDGSYSSGTLPLGNYRVRFFTVHTGSQWWQYALTFDQATTVSIVADGQAVTGVEGWFNMP